MKFAEKIFLKDLRSLTRITLFFFLALGLLIFLVHGVMVLGFKYPLDYGEGPLLNQALRMVERNPLYPEDLSSPPYLISNYPPIYVSINALFVLLFGPSLRIGRLISFLSTLGSAAMLGLIIQHFSARKDYLPMLAGGGVFLVTPYVLQWSVLFRIDMLGLFFSLAGLYLVVRNPSKNLNILFAAGLFISAAYTRQSYGLAAPLAAIIYLCTIEKKQAIRLFLAYGLGGLTIFGFLYLATSGAFFFHIVTANVNPFYWNTVAHVARDILRMMPLTLLISTAYLAVGWRLTKAYPLITPYVLASAIAALTIGKIGSNVNYLVEISAAFALLIGVFLARVLETLPLKPENKPDFDFDPDEIPETEEVGKTTRITLWVNLAIFMLFAAMVLIQLAGLSRESLFGPIASHRDRIKQGSVNYGALEETIRQSAQDGPVLADEYMAILALNRIPLYIQPFEMSQLATAGIWDQTNFLESIEQQAFPLILIHHFPSYPVYLQRWTEQMREALFDSYVAMGIRANSLLFEPKSIKNVVYPENLACPDVPFRLPTQANMGIFWKNGQLLMLGDGRPGEIPVYAVADGLVYQFEGWESAIAIQHEDPFHPGKFIWSFYGDMAPAFNETNPYIKPTYQDADGVAIKAGELIGYQGDWLDASQQTWVHLRFALLPATREGEFPEAFLPIDDFMENLPGAENQKRLGLDGPVPLTAYTGMPESKIFGALDFLPFICEVE